MLVQAKTSKLITQKDGLFDVIISAIKSKDLQNQNIIVIASKVVSVTQGNIIKIKSKAHFDRLVNKEADRNYGGKEVDLTIKNNIFIAWAGIDRSNVEKGYAVLWPKNPYKVTHQLWLKLKKKYKLSKLGVIITDSQCHPLRKGVTAVALGYAGFEGVNDLRGKEDLYKNKLHYSQQAIADMLATSAHLVMGESNEKTPFAIIKDAPVTFTNKRISEKEALIDENECMYNPIFPKQKIQKH